MGELDEVAVGIGGGADVADGRRVIDDRPGEAAGVFRFRCDFVDGFAVRQFDAEVGEGFEDRARLLALLRIGDEHEDERLVGLLRRGKPAGASGGLGTLVEQTQRCERLVPCDGFVDIAARPSDVGQPSDGWAGHLISSFWSRSSVFSDCAQQCCALGNYQRMIDFGVECHVVLIGP